MAAGRCAPRAAGARGARSCGTRAAGRGPWPGCRSRSAPPGRADLAEGLHAAPPGAAAGSAGAAGSSGASRGGRCTVEVLSPAARRRRGSRRPQAAARGADHELGVPEPARVPDLVEDGEEPLAPEELVAGLGVVEREAEQPPHEERVAAAHEVAVERAELEGVDAPHGGDVGALLDRPHQRRDVARVDLEVDVEVAGDLPAGGAEAVGDRGAAAPVRLVEDEREVQARVRGHDPREDLPRAVAARVVDEDDLEGPPQSARASRGSPRSSPRRCSASL